MGNEPRRSCCSIWKEHVQEDVLLVRGGTGPEMRSRFGAEGLRPLREPQMSSCLCHQQHGRRVSTRPAGVLHPTDQHRRPLTSATPSCDLEAAVSDRVFFLRQPAGGPGSAEEEDSGGRKRRPNGCCADEAHREGEEEALVVVATEKREEAARAGRPPPRPPRWVPSQARYLEQDQSPTAAQMCCCSCSC